MAPSLEHFSNTRAVLSGVQGGFFLRKKPLGILLSLYTNWKNALNSHCGSDNDSVPPSFPFRYVSTHGNEIFDGVEDTPFPRENGPTINE
jgi:hypothetical protein